MHICDARALPAERAFGAVPVTKKDIVRLKLLCSRPVLVGPASVLRLQSQPISEIAL